MRLSIAAFCQRWNPPLELHASRFTTSRLGIAGVLGGMETHLDKLPGGLGGPSAAQNPRVSSIEMSERSPDWSATSMTSTPFFE